MSYIIRPFRSDVDIFKSFDCHNADLNDFLIEAEPFYAKCGFTRLSEPKDTDETILMIFDLKSWNKP